MIVTFFITVITNDGMDDKILNLLNNKIEFTVEERKHFTTWGYTNTVILSISSGYPDYFKLGIVDLSFGIWRFTLGTRIFEFSKAMDRNYYTILPLTIKLLLKKPKYNVVVDFTKRENKNREFPHIAINSLPIYSYGELNRWIVDQPYFEAGIGFSFNFITKKLFFIPFQLNLEAGYKIFNDTEQSMSFPIVRMSVSTGLWSPDFNFKVFYSNITFFVEIDGKRKNQGDEVILKKGLHNVKLKIKNTGQGWTVFPLIFTIGGKSIDFCKFEFVDKRLKYVQDKEEIAVNTNKILRPEEEIEINIKIDVIKEGRGSLIFEWTDFRNREDVKDFTLFLKSE